MVRSEAHEPFVQRAGRDVGRSKASSGKLDLEGHHGLPGEKAARTVIHEPGRGMPWKEPFFETFPRRDLRDTSRSTEGLVHVWCNRPEAAHSMVHQALEPHREHAAASQDHGAVSGRSFYGLEWPSRQPVGTDAGDAAEPAAPCLE